MTTLNPETTLADSSSTSTPTVIHVTPSTSTALRSTEFHLISINISAQAPLKLTTTNYMSWKIQFQTLFIGYDLLGYTDGSKPCPPATLPANDWLGKIYSTGAAFLLPVVEEPALVDVDLLVEKGIIFNCPGDNAAIANIFNKLGLHVTPSYSCYYEVAEKLKAYYGNRWNHSKATLKRVYFSDPWIGTGTVAAALLLLLTFCKYSRNFK